MGPLLAYDWVSAETWGFSVFFLGLTVFPSFGFLTSVAPRERSTKLSWPRVRWRFQSLPHPQQGLLLQLLIQQPDVQCTVNTFCLSSLQTPTHRYHWTASACVNTNKKSSTGWSKNIRQQYNKLEDICFYVIREMGSSLHGSLLHALHNKWLKKDWYKHFSILTNQPSYDK